MLKFTTHHIDFFRKNISYSYGKNTDIFYINRLNKRILIIITSIPETSTFVSAVINFRHSILQYSSVFSILER